MFCRDFNITQGDVDNINKQLDVLKWRLHPDVAASIHLHTDMVPENVLVYQKYEAGVIFCLGIVTPFMLYCTLVYGHGQSLMLDGTFKTNNLNVSVPDVTPRHSCSST